MPTAIIQGPPGFAGQATRVQAGGRWWNGNLVRWRQGGLEKMPGWVRLVDVQFFSFVRRMHAWLDLENRRNLMVGSDLGLQILKDDVVGTLSTSPLRDPRQMTWHLDNLGKDGLALQTGGPLNVYNPNDGSFSVVPTGPSISNGMLTSMPQAQVILWGTEPIIHSGVIDPLFLRFSDVGTYDEYTATVSNQAGSYRLSSGSRIMGAIKAPQTILIFTDVDVWSMSYIGPPLVYGFTIMGTGCGLVAPHAVCTLGRTTYWQGAKGIWQFGDGGVQPVMSTVHDYIFEDIDVDDIRKCHAGANSIGNEVAFYFPSRSKPFRRQSDTADTGTTVLSNETSRYVKLTTTEPAWDSGELGRTAWINNNVFGMPLGADLNHRVQQHERGFDDDDQPMRGVFAESGFSDISGGSSNTIMSVDHCQPDFKWFGKNGAVNLTLTGRGYAGGKQFSYGPYSMTETTQFFNPRMRHRYVAVRYDWAARRGFSARVGATKLQIKQAGRRP